MNIEDIVAYDVLTKEFKSSTNVLQTITTQKEFGTAYSKIATIHPKLKGRLTVQVNCSGSVLSTGDISIAIYDTNNKLITEGGSIEYRSQVKLTFDIEQPLTSYTIKMKKTHSSQTIIIEKIHLLGEIYDTGKLYVAITEE